MRSASSASTKFPVIDISRALRVPTARGNNAVSPQVATTPSRAWVSAKRARSDATTNDDESAISSPPDTHAPFTAAITGVVMARSALPGLIANCASNAFHGLAVSPDAISLKSTPALNTGSTAVSTTERMPGSSSASDNNAHSRTRMAVVSAFFASGLLSVIVRIPWLSSTRRWSSLMAHPFSGIRRLSHEMIRSSGNSRRKVRPA